MDSKVMGEIQEIKAGLTKLEIHAAQTDMILHSIGETQKDIAQILKAQSAQEVKNKIYDDAIRGAQRLREKLEDKVADNRVTIAKTVAVTTLIVGVFASVVSRLLIASS